MPLPERPNVGEFFPSAELQVVRKRAAFRWRVLPAALLSLPTALALIWFAAIPVILVVQNPLADMWDRPSYMTEPEWFVRNARHHVAALAAWIGAGLWGVGGCLLMRDLLKGRWFAAVVMVALLVTSPALAFFAANVLIPSFAEALVPIIYPGQPYNP